MFLLKLLSLNNIITYTIYAFFIIIILFLIYKYLYLEQAVYLINNKIERIENEIENSNCCSFNNNSNENLNSNSNQNSTSSMMKNAEIIMNEIFNMEASPNCCPTPHHRREEKINKIEPVDEIVPVIEEPIVKNNIFDLKRKTSPDNEKEVVEKEREEINDKESIVSNIIGGGHAVKKSLMKLTIDKLKEKCEERNLSTEGTKNQLADRIIIFDNENSQE